MIILHYWTHDNSPDPTDGSKWWLNSHRLMALEVLVKDCQRRRNSSGKDHDMMSYVLFLLDPGPIIVLPCLSLSRQCCQNHAENYTKFVKVVTNICQSCYLYFLPNQTKLRFDQDFVACWSFYFCCCTDCWREYYATCMFGFDINFLCCNSQLVPKVVFCFQRLARSCDYKSEFWAKIVNSNLNIQPSSSTQCLSLLCLWQCLLHQYDIWRATRWSPNLFV